MAQQKPNRFQDSDVIVIKLRNIIRDMESLQVGNQPIISPQLILEGLFRSPSIFFEGDYYKVEQAGDFYNTLRNKI